MAVDLAKTLVEEYEDKDILDYIDSCLGLVKRRLESGGDTIFDAGVAAANVTVAQSILKAYREKKFGTKPTQVL